MVSCLVEGLKRAAYKAVNYGKLKETVQGKHENPAQFMVCLGEMLRCFTVLDPERPEGCLILNMHFITQSALDIRKKLQKLDAGPPTPQQDFINFAFKVFSNREETAKQQCISELQMLDSTVRQSPATPLTHRSFRPPNPQHPDFSSGPPHSKRCIKCQKTGHRPGSTRSLGLYPASNAKSLDIGLTNAYSPRFPVSSVLSVGNPTESWTVRLTSLLPELLEFQPKAAGLNPSQISSLGDRRLTLPEHLRQPLDYQGLRALGNSYGGGDMDESGEHHSQQTDTRTENETPHILTHRQDLVGGTKKDKASVQKVPLSEQQEFCSNLSQNKEDMRKC
uniref:Core shell protein Gag P30 domain-containing protein n=1 Tax=Callithrix jacchus TaxID=9483 RepID=A0A8I3VVU3_CALJA